MAIRGVQDLVQRWMVVPPSGKLKLSWPLRREFLTGAARNPTAGEWHRIHRPGAEHPDQRPATDAGSTCLSSTEPALYG
jgi:hypothetical protein